MQPGKTTLPQLPVIVEQHVSAGFTFHWGPLLELSVGPEASVKKGQVLARLALPDLDAELRNFNANLATLLSEDRQLSLFGNENLRLQADSLEQQRRNALQTLAVAKERHRSLSSKATQQESLLTEGLVTAQSVQSTRDGANLAMTEIGQAENTLKDLVVRETDLKERIRRENADRKDRIDKLKRSIADLEDKIRSHSFVVSPSDGRIIEVRAAVGSLITAGTPLVSMELAGEGPRQELQVLLYVPGADGKKIQRGMSADTTPTTVKQEEHGALKGVVTSVSQFPSTQQAMLANLGNPDLVATFFRAIDTPIETRVDLVPSETTPSGFEWTSPKGPPSPVLQGTLCRATITVSERAPISLVVPYFKETLGL
jgi:HlyD family secretion protein